MERGSLRRGTKDGEEERVDLFNIKKSLDLVAVQHRNNEKLQKV